MTKQGLTKQEIIDALDRAMQVAEQLERELGKFNPRAKPLDARRAGQIEDRARDLWDTAHSLAYMLDLKFRYPSLPERDLDADSDADC